MPSAIARPIEPVEFPWYDYRGFTFSLGLEIDGHVINSGHSGSAYDPVKGKPDVCGGMADQARIAYAKQAAVLAGAGRSLVDVTRVVENVTIAGLAEYAQAEAVRRELFGAHQPVVVTVVVDRLVRRKALIEIEVHASPGAGRLLHSGDTDRWRRETVREGHDGAVYLPTILPIEPSGAVHAPDDLAEQYAFCLRRAGDLLSHAGLSLSSVVSTLDYTSPASRDQFPAIADVRHRMLGPVRPATTGVVMSRLHEPGVLVALDLVASRHPLVAVTPQRPYEHARTRGSAVAAGRTLYLGGLATLDAPTALASTLRNVRGQAEIIYAEILRTMAAVGVGPENLLSTVEYILPEALPAYREVAEVRREMLREPYPVSTGIVCAGLPRPEFMVEVVATALITGERT